MTVTIQEELEIGKGDIVFSKYFFDKTEGCDIVPHDSKDDSDRKDPFLNILYEALTMLPGRLLFVRTIGFPAKSQAKRIIKALWNIDAASYHSDSGFEFVCDEKGEPVTLAQYSEDETKSLLFLYLPRGLKNHEIPAYTDEELKTKLEEALNAPIH